MMIEDIKIQFFGAAGTVTGSKHLITLGEHKILVDCGLFQGENEELLNNKKLPLDVSEINCVLLTHGHLDHCGYLPVLVREGFKGKIFGTAPTLAIANIILKDSAQIAEEKKRLSKQRTHRTPEQKATLELQDWQYFSKEVDATVRHFESVDKDAWYPLFNDVQIRFRYNGHIIGATFIEIKYKGKTIVFSGDIGREKDLLLHQPEKPQQADLLVIESTYGDRLHISNPEEQLKHFLDEAYMEKGTVIIPCFAVERSQQLMYMLWKMKSAGTLPNFPMYLDSPMATEVLEVFRNFPEWHKLSQHEITEMCEAIKIVDGIEETFQIIDNKSPKIVLAGSGMLTGGKVLTYLKYYISLENTNILLTGFQGKETLGRKLQEGVKEVEIEGKTYPVNAKVKTIQGLSGHGDKNELLNWMNELQPKPQKTYIVHGEPEASEALRMAIESTYIIHAENALSGL